MRLVFIGLFLYAISFHAWGGSIFSGNEREETLQSVVTQIADTVARNSSAFRSNAEQFKLNKIQYMNGRGFRMFPHIVSENLESIGRVIARAAIIDHAVVVYESTMELMPKEYTESRGAEQLAAEKKALNAARMRARSAASDAHALLEQIKADTAKAKTLESKHKAGSEKLMKQVENVVELQKAEEQNADIKEKLIETRTAIENAEKSALAHSYATGGTVVVGTTLYAANLLNNPVLFGATVTLATVPGMIAMVKALQARLGERKLQRLEFMYRAAGNRLFALRARKNTLEADTKDKSLLDALEFESLPAPDTDIATPFWIGFLAVYDEDVPSSSNAREVFLNKLVAKLCEVKLK